MSVGRSVFPCLFCCSCFVYMSANKYVCLHVGLCFYPSTCLSVNQSISSSLSVGRFSCGSSYLSIFLSVYSPAFRPTDLSVCLFVGRPVHRHITDLLFTVPLVNTHKKGALWSVIRSGPWHPLVSTPLPLVGNPLCR